MEYRRLGKTDVNVSVICLGTMTWGEQNTQEQAFEQLDAAIAAGVNFIDTAEMYPVPPKAETYGKTETIIGNWLKARNNRDKVILATKVIGQSTTVPYVRDGKPRLNRQHMEAALNESLKRLQTDYIDLYQLHWPDRNSNRFGQLAYTHDSNETITPVAETIEVLGEFVRQGKVRHVGLSNETPWGVMKFLHFSSMPGFPRMASIQNPYSLLNRTFEIGLSEIAHREQLGLLAYSPLGFGVLTGKYLNGAKPKDARLTLYTRFTRYNSPQTQRATERYVTLANDHNLSPSQMALAFVHSRPFVTSTIIGATTMEQLNSNIASASLKLTPEILKEIEAIHVEQPNPAP